MESTSRTYGLVFWVSLLYLIVLLAAGVVYVTAAVKWLPFNVPDSLGPVPAGVPWFGAMGAVLISLSGVFDHPHDWDPSAVYWHISRPLIGASLGLVSVLVFQAGILAVNAQPGSGGPRNLLYYLIAFLIGYREETFRELIKRLGDVILTPGGGPQASVARDARLDSGQVDGGTQATVSGAGLHDQPPTA